MSARPAPTLEVLWQPDATALAFVREPDGRLHGGEIGHGSHGTTHLLGRDVTGRRLDVRTLIALADEPPAAYAPGATLRALQALVALARTSVTEGLVHPHLDEGDGAWFAFWGATLDAHVTEQLDAIARALPAVAAAAFDGDAEEAVHDLYPDLVDRIARDRVRAAGLRLLPPGRRRRATALEAFLDGLTAPEPILARNDGYPALARRIESWVDEGLATLTKTRWALAIHLDERPNGDLVAELWLQAGDDPSLKLPARLLASEDGAAAFSFVRAGDPRRDLRERLAEIAPLLPFAFDPERPDRAPLADDDAGRFLRETIGALEERGVPVLLPTAWLESPAPLRVNVEATKRSSGLLSPDALAQFQWRLAVGDTELTDDELQQLAAAKEPFLRIAGRWRAVRPSEVQRALRFLESRRAAAGLVDLVRAVSGLETDEAGLELGDVRLDPALAELLDDGDRRFSPLPTPEAMTHDLFAFQERGHGWLRMLGDLGIGGILADDMGLGKTVQAIAMLSSEREEAEGELGPTLVVAPLSVVRQWARELERFAPHLRVHVHHGQERLHGSRLLAAARAADVVVTSYDVVTRDVDELEHVEWDRVLLDEAQDVKNPATKRARAIRRLPARRRLAMTGTPIENHLGELWSIMDAVNPGLLGSRDWFDRTFARPIETGRDPRALERLHSVVGPFILRRAKDAPEVELALPPITIAKDYCRLTVEQASLYQATVDRWLPRVEAHDDLFGRRAAVLAMLGQLKQVCNHPEMLLATGGDLYGRSGKLERLVELIGEVPADDKALVFTQYPGFDRLVDHLAERTGRRVGFFHGRLSAGQRAALLADFERAEGPSLMVISIRAGGRGLNLPAANHVFHFDRWWNPAVEQQATDRVYRFGQRKPVFVHSLICSGTLEERIDELLESKRDLAETVISRRSDDWLGELDLGTIRAAVALAPDALGEAA